MMLIVNHDFPRSHMETVIESLSKASENNHEMFKFIKKNNLTINYDEVVLKKINF